MSTLKLNSLQLLEDLSIAYGSENGFKTAKPSAKELAADPNAKGKQYRTVVYDKVAFNIDETAFQQWQNGELATMVLEESEVPATITKMDDDGNEITETKNIRRFQFIKVITKKAMINTKKYDAEIILLDKVVAQEYGLNESKLAKLENLAV